MSKLEIPAEGERWVMCPVCGSKLMNEWIVVGNKHCKECDAMITVFATKRFVTTIVYEKEEMATMSERVQRYQKELEALVQ